ncbi:MAG: NAD(P)H-binding protein [Deltaproteobacteria bacterium]|nr:NAD(P)H-binding protein [Nannocystaceae bacterium]
MIGITGATGQLGGLVLEHVLARGVNAARLVALARRPEALDERARAWGIGVRRADYEDPAGMIVALRGIETLLFVAGNAPTWPRLEQHRNVVLAAREAGVGHVVYTGFVDHDSDSPFPFAATHAAAEAWLRGSGLDWTFLRNAIYAELLEREAPAARGSGSFGRVGPQTPSLWATRSELAEAAAIVLLEPAPHAGRAIQLDEGRAWTGQQLAERIARASGRAVEAVQLDDASVRAGLVAIGAPPGLVEAMVGMHGSLEQRRFAAPSPALGELLGRTPTSVADVIDGALAH